MPRRAVLIAVILLIFSSAMQEATARSNKDSSPDWMLAEIRADEIVDFDKHCREQNTHGLADWDAPCRRISARSLAKLLTLPERPNQPTHRVRVLGASIDGPLDLSDTDIASEVSIAFSTIKGNLILDGAHFHRLLSLQATTLKGDLLAPRFHADTDVQFLNETKIEGSVVLVGATIGGALDMTEALFKKDVNCDGISITRSLLMSGARFDAYLSLGGAKIGSEMAMNGAYVAGRLEATSLNIQDNLFMAKGAKFNGDINFHGAIIGGSVDISNFSQILGEFHLDSASVGGSIYMDTSHFHGIVDLDQLKVSGGLLMRYQAAFDGGLALRSAKVGGNLEMIASEVGQPIDGDSISVVGRLLLRDGSWFRGSVNLNGANVGKSLELDGSSFDETLNAQFMNVGNSLGMRHRARFSKIVNMIGAQIGGTLEMDTSVFGNDLYLISAKIGGELDLSDATATRIDLTEAAAQELWLNGLKWECPAATFAAPPPTPKGETKLEPMQWPLGTQDWRRTQCGDEKPMLTLRNAHFESFQDSDDAWPSSIDLEGFHYDRIGGFRGAGRDDMRKRPDEKWEDLLARDPTFSTQPYTELASVLLAAGHRYDAESIQRASGGRERSEAWRQGNYFTWCILEIFWCTVGSGIGLYTFYVFIWALVVTVIGIFALRYCSPITRKCSWGWQFVASVQQLLPFLVLSKLVAELLAEATKSNRNLRIYFAIHGFFGWILGFFLLAAMGQLLQKG